MKGSRREMDMSHAIPCGWDPGAAAYQALEFEQPRGSDMSGMCFNPNLGLGPIEMKPGVDIKPQAERPIERG